jgi:hypothetical protein
VRSTPEPGFTLVLRREFVKQKDRFTNNTEECATWTTNRESELATKRRKRRNKIDSFAHLVPFCGYAFVFHPAVLSVNFKAGGDVPGTGDR